jgi:hypothetical protein
LLKGLGAKEVRLSDVFSHPEKRAEAEFYLAPDGVPRNYVLGQVAIPFAQYGTSDELNEEGIGFPVLRLNEITDGFIDPAEKSCASLTLRDFEELHLRRGDVLVCRTNGNPRLVGQSGLVVEDTPVAFASYLFRVRPDPTVISPASLMVFLNSTRGRLEIEKHSIRSNQVNFSPERLRQARVPRLSAALQRRIDLAVASSYTQRRSADAEYSRAEAFLLRALGLNGWQPPEPLSYVRRAADVLASDRFDAEHHQEQYYALATKLRAYPGGCLTLGEICPHPVNGVEIREYTEEGVPYLRVGDLHNFTVSRAGVKQVSKAAAAAEIEKVRLRAGDVLVSRSGSLAVTCVVEPEWTHAVISSHLIRVRLSEPDYNPHYVAVFLAAMAGRMQIIQQSNGAVQPEISQPSLKRILIPRLPLEQQLQVRDRVYAAHSARQRAVAGLDAAKRAVEIAIGDSETAALAHLNNDGE